MPTMNRFVGTDLISDRISDKTTILSVMHLLEKHIFCEQTHCFAGDFVCETVKGHLK